MMFALGNIDHDGKTYAYGDKLPAMDEAALALLKAAGVVTQVDPASVAADPVEEPTAPEAARTGKGRR